MYTVNIKNKPIWCNFLEKYTMNAVVSYNQGRNITTYMTKYFIFGAKWSNLLRNTIDIQLLMLKD